LEDKTKIRLTSAEMAALWTQFLNDTAVACILTHFLKKAEDKDILPILEKALQDSKNNITALKEIFDKEKFPVPMGFTPDDVVPNAPKLFSDSFVLMYMRHLSILGMSASAVSLGLITRSDIVAFFKNVLKSMMELQDLTKALMLEQGTYIRPPYITVPDKVDFVEKQKFLAGIFTINKRPLTAIEISHLFLNIQTNAIGKALIMGFAQIAKSKDVKNYLMRGKEMAQDHITTFSNFLMKDDLTAPMTWDTAVTDSTKTVFSDKLIMFHITSMIAVGIGNYGAAMAASPRRDTAAKYASMIPEIAHYAEDGANILIKNGWLEEPPMTDDRDKLIKQN
jgi:hypothetical protein